MRTIAFFVSGTPQPAPKKATNMRTGMIYSRDPKGTKRAWAAKLASLARKAMQVPMIEKGVPVRLNCTFFLPRPASQRGKKRRERPTGTPDLSNLYYAVENALKGICYHDDSQVVTFGGMKWYADENSPAGVQVSVEEIG